MVDNPNQVKPVPNASGVVHIMTVKQGRSDSAGNERGFHRTILYDLIRRTGPKIHPYCSDLGERKDTSVPVTDPTAYMDDWYSIKRTHI